MKNWKMRRQILGITRARAPEDAGTKEWPLLSWRGDLAAAIDICKTAGEPGPITHYPHGSALGLAI